MRKKKFFTKARIAVILVAAITFWGNIKAQSPPPDTIKTPTELASISSSGKYVLGNDIDLTGVSWTPITTFSGTLDGNGYAIKNLTLNYTSINVVNYGGLFITLSTCNVKNVVLEDVNIKVTNQGSGNLAVLYFGALASKANLSANITHCSVSGNIEVIGNGKTGYQHLHYVGGLIGNATSDGPGTGVAIIDQCFSTASIQVSNCDGVQVGGLIGIAQGGAIISKCYAVSDIELKDITAYPNTTSPAWGTYMGGLIGMTQLGGNAETTISECYAAGTLKTSGTIECPSFGGLIGYDYARTTPVNNYTTTTWHAKVENCYYDEPKASTYISGGIPNIVGWPTNLGQDFPLLAAQTNTPAQTTANMKQESTFTGWNFTPVSGHWSIDAGGVINDGYPVLQAFYSNSADLLERTMYVFDTVDVHITDGNYPVKIYYSVEDPNNPGTWISPAVANFPYPIEITSGYIARIRTTKVGTFNFRLDSIVDAVITVHPPQVIETLTVLPRPIAWVSHTDIKPQSYTGNPICPIVTLIDSTVDPPYTLIENTDYTVSCANNTKVCDNASITFVMQDNYTGDTTLFFKIKHDCGQDTIWDITSTLVAIKDVEMEDAVNGKNYPTVRLGCDCWTAKNFEGRLDPNGDPVENMIYKSDLYPDTVANLAAFGRLYTYDAATLGGMSAQGICPAGWRLPSAAEWALLNGYAAADLKQLGTGYWMNEQVTNKTGLSIVPGGYYESSTGTFKHLLGDAWYWAYDAGNTQTIVPACHFTFGCPEAIIQQIIRANGASVRCIKAE